MTFLSEQGYQVALINPIETAGARTKRIHNAKTDKIDSNAICKYLFQNDYRLLEPKELTTLELHGICRFSQRCSARLYQSLAVVFSVICFIFGLNIWAEII